MDIFLESWTSIPDGEGARFYEKGTCQDEGYEDGGIIRHAKGAL